MTPHRAPTLMAATQASVRGLWQSPVESPAAAGAGVVALLGWAFGAANTPLLWIVGLAMLLDLVVGSLRAVIDPVEQWTVAELYGGILGKLFRLLLIPTASLIDWLYITSPMPLPDGYTETFPVTALIMVALAAAELSSILNHFRDGGVAPSVISVIMRHVDRIRLGGQEPPARRHYDAPAIVAEHEREEGKDA